MSRPRKNSEATGFRFAYVTHLSTNAITLLDLDSPLGPAISDVGKDLLQAQDGSLVGSYAVASRPCSIEDPPLATLGCARPLLFVSQRFWPGVRTVSVQGQGRIIANEGGLTPQRVSGADPSATGDRPFMGDLRFEAEDGNSLLVVSTTPPALLRVDTSVGSDGVTYSGTGADGVPFSDVVNRVDVCSNPNQLAIYRRGDDEPLAFVSCYSEDRIAVIGLRTFQQKAAIPVDDGPNEMVVDEARRQLLIVHTLGDSVGIIDLDRGSQDYLRLIGRIAPLRE